MAKNEIQISGPDFKPIFYQNLQRAATEMDELMNRWKSVAEFLSDVTTADLDLMGVSSSNGTRTDLVDFRVAINEVIDLYEGGAVTPTKAPNGVIDKIRKMQ